MNSESYVSLCSSNITRPAWHPTLVCHILINTPRLMSNHPHSPTSLAPVHLAQGYVLKHWMGKKRVCPGIDWHWEMNPVRLLVLLSPTPPHAPPPLFSLCLPYVSVSWTDLGNQTTTIVLLSVWIECVERHIAIMWWRYVVASLLVSLVNVPHNCVCLSVSLSGLLLHVLPCLVACLTLYCGLSKRVKTLRKVWQVRL